MPMVVVAREVGSTKLEVVPGGGKAAGMVDRSIFEGREAIFAEYNPFSPV